MNRLWKNWILRARWGLPRAAKPAESTAGRRHGGPHETRIAPTLARYVRVQALKPDGPNQPGVHMNIEELQVFAAR